MILALVARVKRIIAGGMLAVMYLEIVVPIHLSAAIPVIRAVDIRHITAHRVAADLSAVHALVPPSIPGKPALLPPVVNKAAHADIGGPSQPETQSFHSANDDNMVDLFSGDFSYSIPLLDVGGYPVTIGYNSGVSMDQEASWVGLGWNINPGSITRNLRGIPDDFNGKDSITKELTIKPNETVGVTGGGDVEIEGSPLKMGGSTSIFKNTYRGWGLQNSINASLVCGDNGSGKLTMGLSLANSSQEGLTIDPTISYAFPTKHAEEKGGLSGSVSMGSSYNSRSGLKSLQLSADLINFDKNGKKDKDGKIIGKKIAKGNADISFAYPAYTPTINIPYTNKMTTLSIKVGTVITIVHPNFFLSGYKAEQYIADNDKRLSLPAFGYLNYQSANNNLDALLDFNREKEIPYREKLPIPHIAIPAYTYDVFSISGEGTGGSFRAYRNDIGYVYDHQMTTRDESTKISGDIGLGNVIHGGADLDYVRAVTRSALWQYDNPLSAVVGFRKSDGLFEAAYFRNPGEKTINSSTFYDAMGGDDVVAAGLYQPGNTASIFTLNRITPYRGAKPQPDIILNSNNVVKPAREKRTQSITYLTASEASEVGLSKYIENYKLNQFTVNKSTKAFVDEYYGDGDGLKATYYNDNFKPVLYSRGVRAINFANKDSFNVNRKSNEHPLDVHFCASYDGKLKVPQSGIYSFGFAADDGYELYMNNELMISDMSVSKKQGYFNVNLEGGKLYDIWVNYYNNKGDASLQMKWHSDALGTNPNYQVIPPNFFFTRKDVDSFLVLPDTIVSREKRINSFRKADHISEIDVLNSDGRKYVYGIPVYNLQQKETTFSVDHEKANPVDGLVHYVPGVDDGFNNSNGNDHYYSAEYMPAYAHSFLLTGILSPDYVDLTGDGISDDDQGNAIRFNYTKTAGIRNPYMWRAPYNQDATYNEGFKTDNRDDKGSYISGTKELWYLNAIESKNMLALFTLDSRKDLLQIDSNGVKSDGGGKCLKQIDLYTKADFLKHGKNAIPIKTVHFEYGYEICPDAGNPDNLGKLTLHRIWFSYNGNDKGKKNAYIFNYNKLNPAYATNKYDRWGSYKDPTQNPGSGSNNLITNFDYPYALQDSAVAAANVAAWTLDSIVLPSGGRLKVNYESDDYAYVQNKRAMQMCKIAGFSPRIPSSLQDLSNRMYDNILDRDYMYVAINVPYPVKSVQEVYTRYLEGVSKLYFKIFVKMPSDIYGSGSEYVPGYANIASQGGYGFFNNGKTIWVKLSGIDKEARPGEEISPMVKAALQFLRLNLPSKAYPGSDVGGTLDLQVVAQLLWTQVSNVINTLNSFENNARPRGWAQTIDTSRSVVRLDNPFYKKYGGGLRVKSLITYDYWNKMTGQRAAVYGKEYSYITTKVVNGDTLNISSGVASYEPTLGGEENPWRLPVEYTDQVSILAPVTLGYTEEPLGEAFFPSPSVGYSKVRVRTINATKNRSVNGYDETCFYTTKDFPTITARTAINGDTRKRFKSPLESILKINVRHFLAISQGFKIELNDMNGRIRSQASYAESDPDHWIAYTENFYKVDNQQVPEKHLNNTVLTISPKGVISESLIGKDVELMMDMREERHVSNSTNYNANSIFFTVAITPFDILSMIPFPQREENVFHSIAITKVINRHGVLDSVVAIDKGSKVVTHNLLFDTETGEPVLTSVQNEYNDTVFNFMYPVGWVYEGMAGAYKNVGVVLDHIDIKEGRIVAGLSGNTEDYFYSGDELLVFAKRKVAGTDCDPAIAHWPISFKVWVVDANMLKGGKPDIYFINQDGSPLTGNDISLKIVRSGRRNIGATAGSITMLKNPLVRSGDNYSFVLNDNSRIVNANVTEYKQFWKVPDRRVPGVIVDTFRNDALTRDYTVMCGGKPQTVSVTVEAGKFKSVVDPRMPNDQAANYLDYDGQYLADQQVKCDMFYNKADTGIFMKNDCPYPGEPARAFRYIVPAETYSSRVSQEAADALAHEHLLIEGQAYANEHGLCTYPNEGRSASLTSNSSVQKDISKVTYALKTGKDTLNIHVVGTGEANKQMPDSGNTYNLFAKLTKVNQVNREMGNDSINELADVVVSFYEDAACTIPKVVNNLSIALNIQQELIKQDSVSVSSKSYTVNGTSAVLLLQAPFQSEMIRYSYFLAPNSVYIIKQQ
ncbi:DUF5977 domain-containing protein [Chitinophaga sp. 30R24]|uniref:DUF5977 domain-containing protein n=1 Tax=Chitinophaga sp. 30R24 TaxID=3248838 RepID=UPI003B9062C5